MSQPTYSIELTLDDVALIRHSLLSAAETSGQVRTASDLSDRIGARVADVSRGTVPGFTFQKGDLVVWNAEWPSDRVRQPWTVHAVDGDWVLVGGPKDIAGRINAKDLALVARTLADVDLYGDK